METKEQAILKITEEMVRRGGYNSFSFREIAQQVGIKSSSVHYYFPTKEDLGIAVTKYYANRFMEFLGSPQERLSQGDDPVGIYVAAFRHALTQDKRMCLCGLLGAEIDGLPAGLAAETQSFFARNIDWLTQAYTAKGEPQSKKKAIQTLSLLEGALITSNAMDDIAVFDQAVELLQLY